MSRDPEDAENEPPPPPEPGGTIEVTRWATIGGIVVAGGLLGWITVRAVEAVQDAPPVLPWTLLVVLWVITTGVAVAARVTHVRVHVERRWVASPFGLALLALGKAATILGAVGCGFLLVFAGLFVDRIAVPVSMWRVVMGVVGAVGCALMVLAGRALQRACHIPDGPDGDRQGSGDGSPGGLPRDLR